MRSRDRFPLFGEVRENAHRAATGRTVERVHLVNAPQAVAERVRDAAEQAVADAGEGATGHAVVRAREEALGKR